MTYTIAELQAKTYRNGSLDLRGTQITALPEGLTVGGSLDLRGTQITALPEGLTVGGSLYLSGAQITALPEGLTVGGSLYLTCAAPKSQTRIIANGLRMATTRKANTFTQTEFFLPI